HRGSRHASAEHRTGSRRARRPRVHRLTPMSGLVVAKIGGAAGIDLEAVCDDVARLRDAGTKVVLVHGGSDATNELAERLGHPPRFVTSPSGHISRYTDRRTLEIFTM